ncbi:DUF3108 domain-containing protein [Aestuariirhabdus sp. LZHN29]|uniref:DUF3108 domain-containing protein n=1 Tax=Aestuariirhabdus sp. LZHN29 TaxID=3417462 RepID=UPI003CF85CD8
MRLRLPLFAAACLCLSLPLSALELTPYEATYSATYFGQTGEAVRSLKVNDNGSYSASFNTDIRILLIKFYQHQSSNFAVTSEHLITPLHYQYAGTKSKPATDVQFDWSDKLATNQSSPPWTVTLATGVQDELSYQEQMRLDLMHQRTPLTYQVIEKADRLDQLRFERAGAETLNTPWGKIETVKIKRLRKKGKERETFFWFAPAWDYLLVRIEHIERGSGYQVDLKSAMVNGNNVAPATEQGSN